MNQLLAKMVSLLKSGHYAENPSILSENVISTAAVPGVDEPEQLHHGRRRLKES